MLKLSFWVVSSAQWSPRHAPLRRRPSAARTAATATRIAPFWEEFRRQVGRLEGLRAIPVPPDLKYSSDEALGITARAGAFHSDRLRYGRWLLVRSSGTDVLSAALHPTVYASGHPSLVIDVAFFGAAGWLVSIDYPRPSAAAAEPSPHETRVAGRLAAIARENAALAVPLGGLDSADAAAGAMSPCAFILSSAEVPSGFDNVEAQVAAFKAFREALTAHLDLLVVAPLDASPGAVAAAAEAQAALAGRLAAQTHFIGSEALQIAFGAEWVDTLRSVCLEDSYGLPSSQQLEALAARAAAVADGDEAAAAAGSEFIYIDPSQFFDVE